MRITTRRYFFNCHQLLCSFVLIVCVEAKGQLCGSSSPLPHLFQTANSGCQTCKASAVPWSQRAGPVLTTTLKYLSVLMGMSFFKGTNFKQFLCSFVFLDFVSWGLTQKSYSFFSTISVFFLGLLLDNFLIWSAVLSDIVSLNVLLQFNLLCVCALVCVPQHACGHQRSLWE